MNGEELYEIWVSCGRVAAPHLEQVPWDDLGEEDHDTWDKFADYIEAKGFKL